MIQRMMPIDGSSKAKRLKWGPYQNHLSWAYMKELREKDKTLKIYDVNPYIEVYQLRKNVYGLFNQNCDGMGDVWMYIIVGPERGLVIDTGFGLGNLKGLIEKILGDMPYTVACTHRGPDHVLGCVHFDTVYCHEYEVDNIKSFVKPTSWDYLFDENGANIWLQFDKKDLPSYKDFELIGIPNGYIFNLGEDYEVEAVWMPGYSAGHCMYLDKKGRNLFAGDDVCSDVMACGSGPRANSFYNQYFCIEAYRDQLVKLCDRLDEFDYIFPGHFIVNLESCLMLDILDALNAIVKDPECYDFKVVSPSGNGGEPRVGYHKYVRGFSTISYSMKGVYYPKEF